MAYLRFFSPAAGLTSVKSPTILPNRYVMSYTAFPFFSFASFPSGEEAYREARRTIRSPPPPTKKKKTPPPPPPPLRSSLSQVRSLKTCRPLPFFFPSRALRQRESDFPSPPSSRAFLGDIRGGKARAFFSRFFFYLLHRAGALHPFLFFLFHVSVSSSW